MPDRTVRIGIGPVSDCFRTGFGRVRIESEAFRPASDWGKGATTEFGPGSDKRLSSQCAIGFCKSMALELLLEGLKTLLGLLSAFLKEKIAVVPSGTFFDNAGKGGDQSGKKT
jgi:hypothetical protein